MATPKIPPGELDDVRRDVVGTDPVSAAGKGAVVRIVDGKAVVATGDFFTLWSTIPTTGPRRGDAPFDVYAMRGAHVVAVR